MSTLVNTSSTEISVLKQKHDELLKKSLLTRSQFEGQLKEKTKVISDLKVKEGKDIDTMIEMDKQIKFLNEILYKRNQSIQTIHMLAPKCATYHGRSTFANPKYLKKAQSDKPRLYEIPYDTSDPANRFCPDGEETCFNCKGFGHYARECRKPKRVKDYAYHKEKMMMCKQAEQGVPLQAEQADWLEDTDEEIDEQELEAHYSYMAKIQEVSPAESSSTDTPLEQVQNHDENDVFANVRRHSEQPESINDTYVLEKDDSNVIPDSSNICTNDNQVDQNAAECVDERAALANLIANLTLDTEENKTILKQLKKANASLTQELKECKTNLDESSRALGEATSSRDSSLIALQTKQTELEKYTALNDLTSDYKILQTKLNDTLGLLAIKNIDIKEGLKTKTYEISVVNQKHDELVKKSLLNRSQFEGQLKEKTKVISDLKVKEGKDIDTMIEMEKQIKFLNEILYKRNQSIQTIHMLAPKCATYHGRSTFANPKYCKKAQSDKPCLYEIPYVN
ncbi:integrase, catalytic region, zinc finger, CCHC-type containing protein [Tanacetum coccineum]